MADRPRPNVGMRDRCPLEHCYPDIEKTPWYTRGIVVECVSDYLERCWYDAGRRDFYPRWTPAYHAAQSAAYMAHASALPLKPMPIGSRFD